MLGMASCPAPTRSRPCLTSIQSWRGRAASVVVCSKKTDRKLANIWGKEKEASRLATSDPPSTSGQTPAVVTASSDKKRGWGFFDLSAYNTTDFVVPWGPVVTGGGVVMWFLTFIGLGFVVIPLTYRFLGVDIFHLSVPDRANFMLVSQTVDLAATAALLWVITRKAFAESPSANLFNFDPRDPFTAPHGWATWGLLGVVASPLTVGAVAWLLSEVGYDAHGRGTVDGVVNLIQMDGQTYLDLLATTGLLAPAMEETVFRGFLLTSLTKFMPTWAAVVASSVAFGLAHLSARDLPVLSALGVLLGFTYVRSRNLLTPILIHGAWNSAVLSLLFLLAASGVDVQKTLEEMRG